MEDSVCKCLTEEELKKTNGCGSSYWAAWIFRIPKWFSKEFYCACCRHDKAYTEGKSLIDKYKADDNLLDEMYYSAFHSNFIMKRIKLKLADLTYYCLSTKLSDKCFMQASVDKEGSDV